MNLEIIKFETEQEFFAAMDDLINAPYTIYTADIGQYNPERKATNVSAHLSRKSDGKFFIANYWIDTCGKSYTDSFQFVEHIEKPLKLREEPLTWKDVKADLYTGDIVQDIEIDWVIGLLSAKGYSVPEKNKNYDKV